MNASPPLVSLPDASTAAENSPTTAASPPEAQPTQPAPSAVEGERYEAYPAAEAEPPDRASAPGVVLDAPLFGADQESYVAAGEPRERAESAPTAHWADTAAEEDAAFDAPGFEDEPPVRGGSRALTAGLGASLVAGVGGLVSRIGGLVADILPAAERPVAAATERQTRPARSGRSFWKRAEAPAMPEPFQPPAPARGQRARLFILLALLIAVLVPVVVMVIGGWRGSEQRADANALIQEATTRYLNGQSALDAGDFPTARQMFAEAQDFLNASVAIIGNTAETNEVSARINVGIRDASQARYL